VLLERHFIYFPARGLSATPAEWGLPFEEARFGLGGRLHGWFIPGPSDVTLLWFHGNAGTIALRLPWLERLRAHLGVSVFIFDYQGYGLSEGQPSEENTYADARAALAYLRARPDVDPGRVVYFGKSLGGAVAVQLATEEPPHRLVIQSTFTSVPHLARRHYPFVPGALIRTRYASLDKIGRVRAPLLIVHGDGDPIVPPEHARLLYEAAAEPKRLLMVEGAGHNDVLERGGRPYLDALRAFCCEDGSASRARS
jgi:fermentation-respiration switch protein FrsA (DUF1100 family)